MYNFNIFSPILRKDFKSFLIKVFKELNHGQTFIDGWYIDLICDRMQRAINGENRKLIVNIPPRYLKSMIGSIALPAFILGHKPETSIMCISYSEELASKLAHDCRAIMNTKWYRELFPKTTINQNRNALMDFETTMRGGRYSTTMGGSMTGRGADYIIIDDPLKAADANSDIVREKVNELYKNSVSSRLNDKKTGRIIVIMQRLHENDLTGYLLDKDLGYYQIKLPLIAEEDERWEIVNHLNGKTKYVERKTGELLHPKRENFIIAEEHKKNMGYLTFAGQYQQNPAPIGGGAIKQEQLNYYGSMPRFRKVIASWDTGAKISDNCAFSACVIIGLGDDGKYYLIKVLRDRLEFPELVKKAEEVHNEYESKYPNKLLTIIEDASSGTQLFQQMKKKNMNVRAIRSKGSKEQRFNIVTLKVGNGDLLFPNCMRPWYKDFEVEMLTFPKSQFKDQCDALSQAINYFDENQNNLLSDQFVVARHDTLFTLDENTGTVSGYQGKSKIQGHCIGNDICAFFKVKRR